MSSLVLVTGVSGFLGAHVVDKLITEGKAVRGTARSAKVARVQGDYDKAYGSGKVEIVAIDDIIGGDFTSALEGVTAVIHLASPLPGSATPEVLIDSAVEGTTNILIQAQKAGIKNFAIVSSIGAAIDFACLGAKLDENSWNHTTRELALGPFIGVPIIVYGAAKALAEKAIWAFAKEHPEINIITLVPTFFMGPHAPGQSITVGETKSMSTNAILYNMFIPGIEYSTPEVGFVDVRDVAACLVAAIRTSGQHRIMLTGEWFEFKDAIEHINSVLPELKERFSNAQVTDYKGPVMDNTRAKEILGVKLSQPWKESLILAVDEVIKLEKEWLEQGVNIETIRKNDWRA